MASDARGGVPRPRAPSRRAARHAMERWVVLERLREAIARMEDGSESRPMVTTSHPRVRRVMGPDPAGTPVGHGGSVSAHRSGAPGIVLGGGPDHPRPQGRREVNRARGPRRLAGGASAHQSGGGGDRPPTEKDQTEKGQPSIAPDGVEDLEGEIPVVPTTGRLSGKAELPDEQ